MSSPFPGMDPWLESRWGSFHTRFLVYLCDTLGQTLPAGLWAEVEEQVWVDEADGERRTLRPDAHVRVAETRAAYAGGGTAVATRPVSEPTEVLREDRPTQRSVRITDAADGGRLVTAIELLSPTNKKRGRGVGAYLAKQMSFLEAGVNLLEIDLLRAGSPVTLAPRDPDGDGVRCGYHLSLRNFRAGDAIELYAFALADPLPKVALPLRVGDEPVPLDLQEVLEETNRRGRYAERFDYAEGPPGTPLAAEDRAWVEGRVAAWRATSRSTASA